jgi:hypothetical protein
MPPPSASDYESGDPEGQGNYGVMALVRNPSRDTLGEASSLTGLSVGGLKSDRAANVSGGAAVLADLGGEQKPSDLGGWYDAVSKYGGGALYAEQVYQVLKRGTSATTMSCRRKQGFDEATDATSVPRGLFEGHRRQRHQRERQARQILQPR